MLRAALTLFFLLTIGFPKDYYEGDKLVKEGVHAFYNYEFDHAIELLTQARNLYPDHPGVHLCWAAARWVRSQAFDSIDENHQILENDLDTIYPIYENLVETFDHDPVYRLYQGSAIGLSARVSLGKKEWLRTLYRAYKGFSIIDDVAEESPHLLDARLPIGIVEYYAGISNVVLKWTVELYGLNASKESGLSEISKAANESDWAWIEAKGILGFLYLWVENEPIMAYKHSRDLVEHFPRNFYFNILFLESMIRTGKLAESEKKIIELEQTLSNLTKRQKEWYTPYYDYEKALLAFHQKKYKEALTLASNTISTYTAELDIILGNAYLLQGMIYDKLDNREEAKASYKKCLKLDNFSSAMEKAEQYLKTPFYK
jgi:hypothetical protein